jgi:GR25 family glycosyltransferase involved in LPS biosynthesis
VGYPNTWIYGKVGHNAYVITLEGHEYSEAKAARCIETAAEFGLEVKRFRAVDSKWGEVVMRYHGLRWTWAGNNTHITYCEQTGLRQHPYGKLAPKIGCSMSHYRLWMRCVSLDQTILILEHDAVFLRPLPEVEFNGICQINDPKGATPGGDRWSKIMQENGPGVHSKTLMMIDKQPDGLAGNSAYLIKPWAARELIKAFHTYGVWPNDATMCCQLFPWLQELYPFVTRVDQSVSTTGA